MKLYAVNIDYQHIVQNNGNAHIPLKQGLRLLNHINSCFIKHNGQCPYSTKTRIKTTRNRIQVGKSMLLAMPVFH